MIDQTTAQRFATAFRTHIQDTLVPQIEAALAEQRLTEEAMLLRWEGHRMAGVSWPSSSFSVTTHGNAFHFNMPAKLATDENCALVEAALAAAEAETSLSLDARRVRGGSNFVVEGRLYPASAPPLAKAS